MALKYPLDLDAWQRWQTSRNTLRRIRTAVLPGPPPALLYAPPADRTGPSVLVALDSGSPTSRASLIGPLERAGLTGRVGYLSSTAIPDLPGLTPLASTGAEGIVDPAVVVSLGHFMHAGHAAWSLAQRMGAPYLTVQHGLLTPWMAPLAPGTTLLAWTEADGDFWRSGRGDVDVRVVGSQLLWDAAHHPAADGVGSGTPLFLGQLHGAELPRRVLAATAEDFCRREHATYRPHPSERDKRSRLTHRRWERQGITIDRSGTPLSKLDDPIVSVFSTGVLEAAARGIPAWVTCTDPPEWLREFWSRYDMRPWGGAPTPAPTMSDREPALAVADVVREMMGP